MNETIKLAVEATKKNLPDHFETLLGEQSRGNKWGQEFLEKDFGLGWTEAPLHIVSKELRVPHFKYFLLPTNAMEEAFPDRETKAIPLNALTPLELQNVRIRQGAQGAELFYDNVISISEMEDVAWLILAPNESESEIKDGIETFKEELVVLSVQPGPMMKRLPAATFIDFFNKPFIVNL